MKKVTIITGPLRSGKSRKAKELSKDKKTVWLTLGFTNLQDPFAFSDVDKDTECVVFDDLTRKQDIDYILSIDNIKVNKKGQNPISIAMPEIIICAEKITKTDYPYANTPVGIKLIELKNIPKLNITKIKKMNLYMITNGDMSCNAFICSSGKKKALNVLKHTFNDKKEFRNEYPKKATIVVKVVLKKEGVLFKDNIKNY